MSAAAKRAFPGIVIPMPARPVRSRAQRAERVQPDDETKALVELGRAYLALDSLGALLRAAEVRGHRKRSPSELEMVVTRVVRATRVALEQGNAKVLSKADAWARDFLDEHEGESDRHATWPEAGARLVAHAKRVLGVKTWTVEDALRECVVHLMLGIRKPSRAQYVAAAMIVHARVARGGPRFVVDGFDPRAAARSLAAKLDDEGLGAMTPRLLARLSARAVGMSRDDVRRLLATPDKRAQRARARRGR